VTDTIPPLKFWRYGSKEIKVLEGKEFAVSASLPHLSEFTLLIKLMHVNMCFSLTQSVSMCQNAAPSTTQSLVAGFIIFSQEKNRLSILIESPGKKDTSS
jgi:hypothetical protein